ncbi:cyclin-B1-1 isoform X2 [Triticum aestivum]|nr:cyclin-B1-1-like isoform X2 [Triticum aestivum]
MDVADVRGVLLYRAGLVTAAASVLVATSRAFLPEANTVGDAVRQGADLFYAVGAEGAHFPLHTQFTVLSHVLSARSKFAARITEEPAIQDIDKLDGDNQLAVVDYIEDIYKFYKVAEGLHGLPAEINAKMWGILIDWILEVHQKFDMMPESLYLTVYIIDMYLSLQSVLRRELQLVGVSALLIACNYEEIWAHEVNDFILISDSAYTREQILKMEKAILNMLEWNLTVPTPYVFLVRFTKVACSSSSDQKHDKECEHGSVAAINPTIRRRNAREASPPVMPRPDEAMMLTSLERINPGHGTTFLVMRCLCSASTNKSSNLKVKKAEVYLSAKTNLKCKAMKPSAKL